VPQTNKWTMVQRRKKASAPYKAQCSLHNGSHVYVIYSTMNVVIGTRRIADFCYTYPLVYQKIGIRTGVCMWGAVLFSTKRNYM